MCEEREEEMERVVLLGKLSMFGFLKFITQRGFGIDLQKSNPLPTFFLLFFCQTK